MKKIITETLLLVAMSASMCIADDMLEARAKAGDPEAQYKLASMLASKKEDAHKISSKNTMLSLLEQSAEQDYIKSQIILSKIYFDEGLFKKSVKWASKIANKSKTAKSIMSYFYYFGGHGVKIDRAKALEFADSSSSKPISKFVQGQFYLTGSATFEPDLESAKNLANDLLKMHNPYGHLLMAQIYMKDDTTLPQAYEELQKAVDQNCYPAAVTLANFLLSDNPGLNQIVCKIRAASLYLYASSKEIASSYVGLAKIDNDSGNIQESLNYLEKAASLGDPHGALLLWHKLANEKEGSKDQNINKAKKYLKTAINSGDPEVLYSIGTTILQNNQDDDNKDQNLLNYIPSNLTAEYCLKYAALANHSSAKMLYGNLLINQGNDDGFQFIKESAIMGNSDAQLKMALEYFNDNKSESFKWAMKSAKEGNSQGLMLAGNALLRGMGCRQDIKKGIKMLTESYYSGETTAAYCLSTEYYNGTIIEQDLRKAYVWMLCSKYLETKPYITEIENTLDKATIEDLQSKASENIIMHNIGRVQKDYKTYKTYHAKYLDF